MQITSSTLEVSDLQTALSRLLEAAVSIVQAFFGWVRFMRLQFGEWLYWRRHTRGGPVARLRRMKRRRLTRRPA